MAIVLEVLNRAGHALSLKRFDDLCVTIGRGFDQDLIIDDAYTDAKHVQLQVDSNTLEITCVDMGSINGVFIEPALGKKRRVAGAARIVSGDILWLGRSRVRVCNSFHPVAQAKRLTRWHNYLHILSAWPIIVLMTLLAITLNTAQTYLQLPIAASVRHYALESSYIILMAFAYASVWALVGRTLRGDGRLVTQLLLSLAILLVFLVWVFTLPWLNYHLPWQFFWRLAPTCVMGALVFVAFYCSARMATRLRPYAVMAMSAVLPIAMAASALLKNLDAPDSTSYVPYLRVLVAPSVNLRQTQTSSVFVQQSESLFERAILAGKSEEP